MVITGKGLDFRNSVSLFKTYQSFLKFADYIKQFACLQSVRFYGHIEPEEQSSLAF